MPDKDNTVQERPLTLGNVWHLRETEDGALQYLSDQWQGRVFGYEQRGRTTLAQSGEVAIGMIAFGGASAGVTRPIPDRMQYHMRDEKLEVHEWDLAAESAAVAWLSGIDRKHHALSTVIAISEPRSSMVEQDALPNAPMRQSVLDRVSKARDALKPWNKFFHVDRISLSLLEGNPDIPETTADFHYAAVAKGLQLEVAEASGQIAVPKIVVSQSAGTHERGDFELILAEGRLHWNHFSIGFVVATPRYPFRLMKGTVATLHPADALLMSELESRAIEAVMDGKDWFCPSLEEATVDGATIRARFASMSDLVLDESAHGFRVDGCTVTGITVNANYVQITLDKEPASDAMLSYAWGAKKPGVPGFHANTGGLRDSWSDQSRLQPGRTLYRYALAGRVPLRSGQAKPPAPQRSE